jgi:hypothetical protein
VDLGPPDLASPSPQQLRPEERGAYSVNPQSGAATYTYPFTLPPARGFAPGLSLSYTSNGTTRGDIAQGWSLGPIPVIRRDVQREVSPNTPQYTAHVGGTIQELMKIDAGLDASLLPSGASSVESYRAIIDHDFTRFEQVTVTGETGNSHYWIAFSPDGKTSYFGDDTSNVAGDASSRFGDEYYLARVVDRWGNTVSYHYQTVTDPTNATIAVDRLLSSISYSANPGANLPDHAQVLLTWQTPARCATDTAWAVKDCRSARR